MGNKAPAKTDKQATPVVVHAAPIKPVPSVIQFNLHSHKKIMEQLTLSIVSLPRDVLGIVGGYLAPNIRLAFCADSEVVIYHLETDVQETRPIMNGDWIGLLSDNVVCVRASGPHFECSWLDAKTLKVTSISSPGEKLFDNSLLLGQGEPRWLHLEGHHGQHDRPIKFCSQGPNPIEPMWLTGCLLPQELPDGRVVLLNCSHSFAALGKNAWVCRHCTTRNKRPDTFCTNCSRSMPADEGESKEDDAAPWNCKACRQQNINTQVAECPRCSMHRYREREVMIKILELSPDRSHLDTVQSWVADDYSPTQMALFPAHIVIFNFEGDIKVWRLPKSPNDVSELVCRWRHSRTNCTMVALPADRVAVGSSSHIDIYDIESGQLVKTIKRGGRGLCALPDVAFLDL